MPKERRDRSVSFDRLRVSPFPCSSSRSKRSLPKSPLECEDNVKEWEDARCPVCMEHPHNAILLLCSSHEKGCRPYMCDTSYRHSNCFDQFRKSFSENSPTMMPQQEETPTSTTHSSSFMTISEATVRSEEGSTSVLNHETRVEPKLACPLCRGQINGWIVVESARHLMNAKSRSCACETCDFSGMYTDLRKHARLVHPLVRPSEVDPERQRDWRRLERQRDLGDLLSTLQSSMGGEDRSEESILSFDEGGGLFTVFLLVRVFRPGSSSGSSSALSGTSRTRAQRTFRRRLTRRLWGESYDGETESASRDENDDSSDGGSGPLRRPRRRVLRQLSPDDE